MQIQTQTKPMDFKKKPRTTDSTHLSILILYEGEFLLSILCNKHHMIHKHLSSFLVLLCVWLRSYGHFTSPTPSVSPRGIFNKNQPSLEFCTNRSYGHFNSPTPSMSPHGIFNKNRPSLCTNVSLCIIISSLNISTVTVTSLRPPRLCRLAVFSIKPTLLSSNIITTVPIPAQATTLCTQVFGKARPRSRAGRPGE